MRSGERVVATRRRRDLDARSLRRSRRQGFGARKSACRHRLAHARVWVAPFDIRVEVPAVGRRGHQTAVNGLRNPRVAVRPARVEPDIQRSTLVADRTQIR